MGTGPSHSASARLQPRRDDEERGESSIRRMPLRAAPGAHLSYKNAGDRAPKGAGPEAEYKWTASLSSRKTEIPPPGGSAP